MNILIASVTGNILLTNFFYEAFSELANTVIAGPYMKQVDYLTLLNDEKNHLFKSFEESQANINIISNQITKSDFIFQNGEIDCEKLYKNVSNIFKPDLILWIETNTFFLKNIEYLKDKCLTACYIFNTHTSEQNRKRRLEYSRKFDYTFLTFKNDLKEFKNYCENSYWIPVAYSPAIYNNLNLNKIYDWCFVGQTNPNLHEERVKLIKKVYKNKSNKDKQIKGHVATAYLSQANYIFNQSKISLNHSLNNDLNMRVFESMGSGTLLFTDKLTQDSGLYDLFEDKKHLILYEKDNIIELMNFYLNKQSILDKIRQEGYKYVQEKHTYKHRAKSILDIINSSKKFVIKNNKKEKNIYICSYDEINNIRLNIVKDKNLLVIKPQKTEFSTNKNIELLEIEDNKFINNLINKINSLDIDNIVFFDNKEQFNSKSLKKEDIIGLDNQDSNKSIEVLKIILEFYNNFSDIYVSLANEYIKIKNYTFALNNFTQAVKKGYPILELKNSINYCISKVNN